MKKQITLLTLMFVLAAITFGQKAEKLQLIPKEATPAQEKLLQEGVKLHDEGKYDEAIAKYQKVLDENPDNVSAMYEMALSYHEKRDVIKAIETAQIGIKYKSDTLPLFYVLIANVWDEQGKPEKAIQIYKDGIKMLEGETDTAHALGSLYYNLAVTYVGQKNLPEAKAALKKAVEKNPSYASPNALLAEIFYSTRYRVPAMLAAARLISLEFPSKRTQRGAAIFTDVLAGGAQKGDKPNTMTILIDPDEPTDEGDFSGLSMMMGLVSAGTDAEEENKGKTEEEKFVAKVDSMIAFLASDAKKTKATFVGKNYVPFMLEIRQRGYVEAFAYLVMLNNGSETAANWVVEKNKAKVIEFLNWAKTYQPPVK